MLWTHQKYKFYGTYAALWASATKNVKKPPGEKGQTFRKEKMLLGVQIIS